jgi:hypothetical protein
MGVMGGRSTTAERLVDRDEKRFRSVPATVESLRARSPTPDEQSIIGDWNGDGFDSALRTDIRENWSETRSRNQAFWTL